MMLHWPRKCPSFVKMVCGLALLILSREHLAIESLQEPSQSTYPLDKQISGLSSSSHSTHTIWQESYFALPSHPSSPSNLPQPISNGVCHSDSQIHSEDRDLESGVIAQEPSDDTSIETSNLSVAPKPWSEQIFKKFGEVGKVDTTDAPSIQEQKQRCPICLSNFRINDSNFLWPDCKHEYHHTCIQPWLTLNPTCPTCRHGLVPALVKRPGAVWRTRAQRFRGLTSGNHRASDLWQEGGVNVVLFIAIIVTSYLLIRSALS
ncbi:hypothetical protein Pst134EA_011584 [Puccinia striiformis f. sp. tritici]|uniref:hypothetical protein n=1 Tax=Puccinia striiformis f. sp. tritici TaxID=168172 RepID=UPI002007AEFF|nr:hypothetical protein Pst134EA_011584 [Puccinia striiformis f. sp. tritici]KAH9467964.1 hypothetical protein Pst134EA_011584 [Puccinia striiformis f. sp. tritici]